MAENGKSGNPAKQNKKVNKPVDYALYKLGDDRNLEFVATATGVTRGEAIGRAIDADNDLAGVPLVPIPVSRLEQLSGSLPDKPRVKVTKVAA